MLEMDNSLVGVPVAVLLFGACIRGVLGSGGPLAVRSYLEAVKAEEEEEEGRRDRCMLRRARLYQADFPSHLGLARLRFRSLRFMAGVTF